MIFFDDYILDVYGEIEDVDCFNQFKNKIKNSYNINYKGKIEKNNLYLKLSRYDIFCILQNLKILDWLS